MAVAGFFRNQFSFIETGKRAKPVPRFCDRCGTGIETRGGKRVCSPCYDIKYRENKAKRRKPKP